jgi:N-acetylneuraminate synthase
MNGMLPTFATDTFAAASISLAKHVFVIGEIGINHNGDISIAKKLVDVAQQAGCDAVKFQKRTIDIVYTPEILAMPRESPWGMTQREQKEGLEFSVGQYAEIDAYCKKVGIEWFASAWDIPSQEFLRRFDCKFNKVASAMMTHRKFLESVASERKPTFASTGMCLIEQVDGAVEVFRRFDCPIILMHTVSTYPASEETLNLGTMQTLRQRYSLPVGYSGHEVSLSPTLMAVLLGAVAVERHITLSRAMYGSDQSASLEIEALKRLVAMIRKVPVVIGDGAKRVIDEEQKVAKKLRYFET